MIPISGFSSLYAVGQQHQPIGDCPSSDRRYNYIGMFRKPVERVMSAFFAKKHAMGFGTRKAEFNVCVDAAPEPMLAFAENSQIKSCMTKMVLGYRFVLFRFSFIDVACG